MKKVLISFAAFLLMGGMELGMSGYAQEVAVKGSIGGTVFDATGAVISGAKVTVIGPTGTRDVTTDADGNFTVLNLVPGRYIVKAEMSGFKAPRSRISKSSSVGARWFASRLSRDRSLK